MNYEQREKLHRLFVDSGGTQSKDLYAIQSFIELEVERKWIDVREAELTDELLIEIAKVIDNDFIGADSTTVKRYNGNHISITTNKCDNASIIKIQLDAGKILSIQRIHEEGTGGDILFSTAVRVINKITELTAKNRITKTQ